MPILVSEVTCRVAAAALVLLAGCPIPERMQPVVDPLSKPPAPPARGLKQASIYGGTSSVSYGVLVAVENGEPVCKADATKTVPLGELKVKLEFGDSPSPDPIVSADFDLGQAAPTSMDENTPPRPVRFPPEKETRMTWQFHRQQGRLVPLSCSLTPMKLSARLVPEDGKTEGFLSNERVPRGVYRLRYQHHEECKLFTATRSDGSSLPEKITLRNGGLSVKVNCDGGEVILSWSLEEEAPSCPHKTECDGHCTNLHSDAGNCGACGNACPSNQVCRQGACVSRSDGCHGKTSCGGVCTNLQTDSANCGACGNACPSNQVCRQGACISRSDGCHGKTSCGGVCTNLQTDSANCGACGNACPSNQVCRQGACVSRSDGCHGKTSCGGGVCTNLQTDSANCGACGRACSPGQVCDHGECPARVYDISEVRCANIDDLSAAKNKQVESVMIEDSLAQRTLDYPKAMIIKLPPTKVKCDLSVNGKPMSVSRACMTLAVPAKSKIAYEGCR